MSKAMRTFINELGNEIQMSVVFDGRGVTVTATGPTSTVEHTWTPFEAHVLRYLLGPDAAEVKDYIPRQ